MSPAGKERKRAEEGEEETAKRTDRPEDNMPEVKNTPFKRLESSFFTKNNNFDKQLCSAGLGFRLFFPPDVKSNVALPPDADSLRYDEAAVNNSLQNKNN